LINGVVCPRQIKFARVGYPELIGKDFIDFGVCQLNLIAWHLSFSPLAGSDCPGGEPGRGGGVS
jgi:hypothetical protein